MACVKAALVLVPLMFVAHQHAGAQEPSTEGVVSQCASAMGVGIDIDEIRVLRVNYSLPDHGAPQWYDFGGPSLLKHESLAYDGLGVAPPGGSQMTYYIDSETYLLVKVVSDALVHGANQHTERLFTNYEKTDGLFYPRAFTYPGRRSGILTGTVLEVVINPPIEPGHFDLPPEFRR